MRLQHRNFKGTQLRPRQRGVTQTWTVPALLATAYSSAKGCSAVRTNNKGTPVVKFRYFLSFPFCHEVAPPSFAVVLLIT